LCGAQEQLHITAEQKTYSIGQRVTLHGLRMKDFNGRSGKVVNFIVDEGRYEIELDGENCPIKVVPNKLKEEVIDQQKVRDEKWNKVMEEDRKRHEEYMKQMMKEARETREQLKKVNEQLIYIEQQQEDFIMSASVAGRSRPVDHIDLTETRKELTGKLESIANKMHSSSKCGLSSSEDGDTFGLDLKNTTVDTDPEDSYDEPSPSETPTKPSESREVILHKLDKRVREVGKTIKNSKVLVTWTFQEGKNNTTHHTVSLSWSRASGRVTIEMDKERVFATKLTEADDPFFVHKWETENGLRMQILASQKVGSTLSLKNHELTVNGERFTAFPSLLY